jgi:transcription antitermination factor NusA-like protein
LLSSLRNVFKVGVSIGVGDFMVDVKALEKMLDVAVEKIEEIEEKVVVHVSQDKIGRAIGPNGSVVRAAELVVGKPIELRGI